MSEKNLFESVNINNSLIEYFEFEPRKQVCFRLFKFPEGKEYFLHFFDILYFKGEFEIQKKKKISRHSFFQDSIFLQKFYSESNVSADKGYGHYQIIYGEDCIDIIAKGFTISLIWDSEGSFTLA